MQFTGERILPNDSKLKLTYLQSLKPYLFVKKFVKGKKVLDVGCGEGYGTHLLSKVAKSIYGLDMDAPAIKSANKKYKGKNIQFFNRNFLKNKFKDKSFDVICSFQTIEHFEDIDIYLKEVSRLLKKGGLFFCTTPNKDVVVHVFNPYHYHEFTASDLQKRLGNYFKKVRMFGVFGDQKVKKVRERNDRLVKRILMLDPLRIRDIAPRNWLIGIYVFGSNLVKRRVYKKESGSIHGLTLKNFRISGENIQKSLDLFAISKKE